MPIGQIVIWTISTELYLIKKSDYFYYLKIVYVTDCFHCCASLLLTGDTLFQMAEVHRQIQVQLEDVVSQII